MSNHVTENTIRLGLYQHYKGNYYQVIGLARQTETLESLVVYKALFGDYSLWARPAAMFNSTVLLEGKIVPRFNFLHETWSHVHQIEG